MRKPKILAIAVLTMLSMTSPVLAQALVLEGSLLPVYYNAQGGRHYHTFGYYGPLLPSLPGEVSMLRWIGPKSGLQTAARAARRTAAISASVTGGHDAMANSASKGTIQ
jgi:hypothetical protein